MRDAALKLVTRGHKAGETRRDRHVTGFHHIQARRHRIGERGFQPVDPVARLADRFHARRIIGPMAGNRTLVGKRLQCHQALPPSAEVCCRRAGRTIVEEEIAANQDPAALIPQRKIGRTVPGQRQQL